MKKTALLLTAFYFLFQIATTAQSVAINKTGAAAHTSAILDIQSTEKGMLIPRMTREKKNAIISPAPALLVYQTNFERGFYYNAGTASLAFWRPVAADAIPAGTIVLSDIFPNTDLENVGFSPYGLMDESKVAEYGDYGKWTVANNNCPIADNRALVAAVWTGTEAIYWGGSDLDNDGARYNPATDTWTYIPPSSAIPGRTDYTAIWTGTEMIIWGGVNNYSALGNGARYKPSTNSWVQMSTVNAPSPRYKCHVFWTGTEIIVWGGENDDSQKLNNGAKYNPTTNSWATISTIGAPQPRIGESVIFTGSKMIVWGGTLQDGTNLNQVNTGCMYNASTNSWAATSTISAPIKRQEAHAIWSGTEMLIYSGYYLNPPQCGNCNYLLTFLHDGGRFNPATNTWTAMNMTGAPENNKSTEFRDVYTGQNWMVFNDQKGKAYNTGTNTWTDLGNYFVPEGETGPTVLANAGDKAIIWGSHTIDGNIFNHYQSGAVWDNAGNTWQTKMSIYNAPYRSTTTPLWTGTELLVFGQVIPGIPGSSIRLGRYNPLGKSFGVTESKKLYLYKKN